MMNGWKKEYVVGQRGDAYILEWRDFVINNILLVLEMIFDGHMQCIMISDSIKQVVL